MFLNFGTPSNIRLTQFIRGKGEEIYKSACQHGLEGIVSKEVTSHYESRRSRKWLKSKCGHRQEFVIVGFTKPRGQRRYFGALLLGFYDRKKMLLFVRSCKLGIYRVFA